MPVVTPADVWNYEDRVGVDRDVRELPAQFVTKVPMRGHAAAVQKAGGRQRKNAGTNRYNARRFLRELAKGGDDAFVVYRFERANASRDDQYLRRLGDAVKAARRNYRNARKRIDAAGDRRGDLDEVRLRLAARLDRPIGAGEDVERPHDVQRLREGKRQHHHAMGWGGIGSARFHGGDVNQIVPWQQCQRRKIFCQAD